uniref:ABC transporter ATP-binding protein n=1 Tax=Castellaniella defragrans TaxID=75697 RepID=UPI00333F0083
MNAVLEVRGLSRAFGGIRAVDSVSFQTSASGITGLIGPNGAGKTTLLNLISGVTRAQSGNVLFRDEAITGMSAAAIARRGLCRTFQMTHVFPGQSVLGNLYRTALLRQLPTPRAWLMPARVRAGRRQAMAHAEAVLQLISMESQADADAGSLPYGLQKILGVGMALSTQPGMLLMDEPAAGLNPNETVEMTALIERIHHDAGIAIVLVEHDMKMVMRLCSELVVLVNGRLLANGPADAVRQDPAVIDAYLGADIENA